MIDNILPREDIENPIFIQYDNARVHVKDDDDEFRQAATQDRFDSRLMSQSSNLSNINILDLWFF